MGKTSSKYPKNSCLNENIPRTLPGKKEEPTGPVEPLSVLMLSVLLIPAVSGGEECGEEGGGLGGRWCNVGLTGERSVSQ